MWVLSVELLLNAFPHWLHLWGFSCTGGRKARQGGLRGEQGGGARCLPHPGCPPPTWVWMILCRHRVLAWRKPFPQTLHTNGLAPVCTGMWRVRL